ncbi:MAG: hypothetical protein C5B51_27610 [Terriglobia bacterium]|nr:MAG: hypothetical protein C5B51_27610 [Terriglobia bacterium]
MSRRFCTYVMAAWLLVAVVLTLGTAFLSASQPYIYRHGWISADFATMARSFTRDGILKLGLVPVHNNPPLGLRPDAYIHWPPLFPILLSWVFDVFGISETSAHALMLVILIANTALVYVLTRLTMSPAAALIAAFAWLTLPLVVGYGHLVLHLHLALTFLLLALVAAAKGRDRGAVVFMVLATVTSWEPLLAAVGLLGAAYVTGDKPLRRTAGKLLAASVLASILVVVVYALRYPGRFVELFEVVAFRMGVGTIHASEILTRNSIEPQLGLARRIMLVLDHYLEMLGGLGTLALVWTFSELLVRVRTHIKTPWLTPFFAMAAMAFLWSAGMSNHVAIHDYEVLLAAPVTAMALGWAGAELLERLLAWKDSVLRLRAIAVVLLVPGIMIVPSARSLKAALAARTGYTLPAHVTGPDCEPLGEPCEAVFGWELERLIPAGAVVVSPIESLVSVYYSNRRVIRMVRNDAEWESIRPQIQADFPATPVYMAVPAGTEANFPRTLGSMQLRKTFAATVARLW